ncbi:hypothetical protein K9M74_04150 [Candidatus Woesearchaeota archaeon]|nr:hypothetical protein [Candidatus Woesearchaeota archaeon]
MMNFGARRKGQTWSFDLLIAVVIFIVVIGIFYAFLADKQNPTDAESLQEEAKAISHLLNCDISPSNFCILKNGEIDQARLRALAEKTPAQLDELGLMGSYCIYLEDANGNLVPVPITGGNKAGIGTDDFMLNDTLACNGTII